jgi:hypothetical protein
MGDHVSLRELAGLAAGVAGAEPPLEILKERGVEINLAIVRTVEWPHGGLGEPTGRAREARKHHERRRLVGFAVLRENLLPLRLRAPEHGRHESTHLVRGRSCMPRTGPVARCRRRLLLRTAAARQDLGTTDQHARIDAQPIADQAEHDNGADSEPAPPAWNAKAAAAILAPAILNVVAARQLIETHFLVLLRGYVRGTCATAFPRPQNCACAIEIVSRIDMRSATAHRVCWLAVILFTSPERYIIQLLVRQQLCS